MVLTYLNWRKKYIAIMLLGGLIFGVSFALYHLPLEAVGYPYALCVVIGVILLFLDYKKNKNRILRLQKAATLSAALIEDLPTSVNPVEEAYIKIIMSMKEEIKLTNTNNEMRYQEMMDYFTIWVHQIKTPIAAMRLTLQNEDSELARTLKADLLRTEQYVDMVLAFFRLDSCSSDYVIRETDLDKLVRQCIKKFANQFIAKKLQLNYEESKKMILTDEKWMAFVIEQILSNAIKYTQRGSVSIYVQEDVLHIKDTGIGIETEDIPRVFERGFTGYNGRSDKKASGIGLFLCKRICENLRHTLYIESKPGVGTTVKIGLSRYELEVE